MDSQIPSSLQPSAAPAQALNTEAAIPNVAAPSPAPVPSNSAPTYEMLQTQSNQSMAVPHDDVYTAVKSGLYLPKKDDQFVVKDSSGDARMVEGEHLKFALDKGYRLETLPEMHDRILQEQHGNSQAATFVEGVGRGAASLASLASKGVAQIPGLEGAAFTPDEAMSKLGLDPQAMQERAEANPGSAFLGQLTGQMLSPEARLVGLGAKGISGAVESIILKDAAKAGVGKTVAASMAAKVVGGMVEGAYYNTGELVSENSLGKADVNAENLLASAGMGALFGGTIAGAAGAVVEAAPYVAKGAKFIASPLIERAEHSVEPDVAAGRLLGLTPAQVSKLSDRNPNVVNGMRQYLKDDLQLSYTDTAGSLLEKNEALRKSAGEALGSALNELDAGLEIRPDLKPTKASVWGGVKNTVEKEYADWLADNSVPGASKVSKPVQEFIDDLSKLSKEDGTFGAKDLQRLKRMQDQLMNYEKSPGKWTIFEDLAHTTRTALKNEIDLVADRLRNQGITDDVAQKIKTANRQYASSATFGDFIEKRAIKAGDKTMSLVGTAKDVVLDVKRKLAVLGTIERAQQSMGRLMDSAVKSFVEPVSSRLEKLPTQQLKKSVPASIIDSEFSKKYDNGKYKKPKSVDEAFVNLNENFTRYALNPEAFLQRSNRGSAQIYKQAPQTSSALDTTAVTAATFLGSKLPKRVSQPGMFDMLSKPRPPSMLDLAKFERYLTAVENPKSVFEDMKAGKLSHEGAETLRAVYPNLFSQLQDKVLDQIKKTPNMPYSKKLQLGVLLNTTTDESLLPANVIALQANFQTQPESDSGAVKPTQSGVKQIGIADRMKTDTQADTELS